MTGIPSTSEPSPEELGRWAAEYDRRHEERCQRLDRLSLHLESRSGEFSFRQLARLAKWTGRFLNPHRYNPDPEAELVIVPNRSGRGASERREKARERLRCALQNAFAEYAGQYGISVGECERWCRAHGLRWEPALMPQGAPAPPPTLFFANCRRFCRTATGPHGMHVAYLTDRQADFLAKSDFPLPVAIPPDVMLRDIRELTTEVTEDAIVADELYVVVVRERRLLGYAGAVETYRREPLLSCLRRRAEHHLRLGGNDPALVLPIPGRALVGRGLPFWMNHFRTDQRDSRRWNGIEYRTVHERDGLAPWLCIAGGLRVVQREHVGGLRSAWLYQVEHWDASAARWDPLYYGFGIDVMNDTLCQWRLMGLGCLMSAAEWASWQTAGPSDPEPGYDPWLERLERRETPDRLSTRDHKVLGWIAFREPEGATRRDLRGLRLTSRELDQSIANLQRHGLVQRIERKGARGPATVAWRAVPP